MSYTLKRLNEGFCPQSQNFFRNGQLPRKYLVTREQELLFFLNGQPVKQLPELTILHRSNARELEEDSLFSQPFEQIKLLNQQPSLEDPQISPPEQMQQKSSLSNNDEASPSPKTDLPSSASVDQSSSSSQQNSSSLPTFESRLPIPTIFSLKEGQFPTKMRKEAREEFCRTFSVDLPYGLTLERLETGTVGVEHIFLVFVRPFEIFFASQASKKLIRLLLEDSECPESKMISEKEDASKIPFSMLIQCQASFPNYLDGNQLYVYGFDLHSLKNRLLSINMSSLSTKLLSDSKSYAPSRRIGYFSCFHEDRLYVFGGYTFKRGRGLSRVGGSRQKVECMSAEFSRSIPEQLREYEFEKVEQLLWTFDFEKGHWFALNMSYDETICFTEALSCSMSNGKILIVVKSRWFVLEAYQIKLYEIESSEIPQLSPEKSIQGLFFAGEKLCTYNQEGESTLFLLSK